MIGDVVHYRVGSLEIFRPTKSAAEVVHYRVGSLEKLFRPAIRANRVHYRVGSLEIRRFQADVSK